MRVTYIANACCVVESAGFRLLTDPWLIDGAFEGAWFHYPPLRTTPESLRGVDALYVSHLHPDHFDVQTLARLPHDIPVVYLEHGPSFLGRLLRKQGFERLIGVADGESVQLGPLRVTLFAPFAKHVFHPTQVGNLIDSAMLVEDGVHSVLDTNDNTLDLETARSWRARHGSPTLAQLNYNAAGPFPSCFANLDGEAKRRAHERVLTRNLDHMAAVTRELEPRWVMPFAGSYVIGGSQWRKNEVLGTTTQDAAAAHVARSLPGQQTLLLSEGLTFDLGAGKILGGTYAPVDGVLQSRYIANELASRLYPHERDEPVRDLGALAERAALARASLWCAQQRYSFFSELNVYLDLGDRWLRFDLATPDVVMEPRESVPVQPYVTLRLDLRLLRRIFERRAHWNNAEIGCHVDFCRVPDVYSYDFHQLMSFFCPPADR